MYPEPLEKRTFPVRSLYILAVVLLLLVWLLPLLAIISTSIRPAADINSGNYWGLPSRLAIFENYSEVFNPERSPMLKYFVNSALITLPAVAISIFISAMAGYALAIYKFKGRIALYALFHIAFQTGFATFFLRNFIVELPFSLVESARVEGATEVKIFISIILPLLKPALASLGVLLFTYIWNDFFWLLRLYNPMLPVPLPLVLML